MVRFFLFLRRTVLRRKIRARLYRKEVKHLLPSWGLELRKQELTKYFSVRKHILRDYVTYIIIVYVQYISIIYGYCSLHHLYSNLLFPICGIWCCWLFHYCCKFQTRYFVHDVLKFEFESPTSLPSLELEFDSWTVLNSRWNSFF